jgi:dihydroorotate dehydrogenase
MNETTEPPAPRKRTRKKSTITTATQIIGVSGVQALADADLYIVAGATIRDIVASAVINDTKPE